jgi:hypothetical protein
MFVVLEDIHRRWLGFSGRVDNDQWAVAIPFYFPTTISAALLWLVWRKTRPAVKGRAFPVELEKPTGEEGGKAE